MLPVASFFVSQRWMNTGVKVLQFPWVLLPHHSPCLLPPSSETLMHITVFSSHTHFSCEYFSDVSFYVCIWSAPCMLPGMNAHDWLQMAGSDSGSMRIVEGWKSNFRSLSCLNPCTSIRHTRRDLDYSADTINIFLYLTAVGATANVLRRFQCRWCSEQGEW